ncbi:DsbA family protein [Demequina sp.]|uniref:DsbA family protein n=1 Tax=Demequina sp. TaxID=2050685 RepID=UPI003D0C50F5
MTSKSDRAAQARAQAKAKAQAEVKAKERRTTAIVIAVSIAVIAVFAGVVYFIVDTSKTPTLAEAHAPAGSDETGGILVGAAGGELRTDIYLDFLCPYCKIFEDTNAETLTSMSEAGDVSIYYHMLNGLDPYSNGTKYSTRTANAAAVVSDRSPEHLADFYAILFANQPAEQTPGLTDAEIANLAVSVGVPQEVADTFVDGEFNDWVNAAAQQASIDGVTATPTFMVNREPVNIQEVPFLQEGVLGPFLESQLAG